MGGTKGFEDWALEKAGGSVVFESEEAHFWISAFAQLVREEAIPLAGKNYEESITNAFEAICQRFGLEKG